MSVTLSERPTTVLPGDDLLPGYRVLSLLSHNQALDVYDVWSDERRVRCIAKVVRPDRVHEARVVERLRNEGRLLLGFTHPNVVRAYELVEDPETALILETLPGLTLDALVETARRPLSAKDLAHLMAQLGSALGYVHRRGALHLDVKPANVIAHAGQAKLIDFSLAQSPGPVPAGRGTRPYRAPEQSLGGRVDDRTDVWGLGVTVFEAATGELPWLDEDSPPSAPPRCAGVMRLRDVRRVPRPLGEVIDACLETVPEHRPSVSDILAVAHGLVDVAPLSRAGAGGAL